jgi:transposase
MRDERQLRELSAQAAALRRAGKSRREIMELTGIRNNDLLTDALRGVPAAPWTRRPNAKDDLRAKARELRGGGHTYLEIAAELGVSKSSVSLWVRDLPRVGRLSEQESRGRNSSATVAYWQGEQLRREAARRAISRHAAREIGDLSDREILIAGAVAYWCEGSKNKPHRRANEVAFINSDPGLVLLFLRFLRTAGIDADRLICRIHIHESADVAAAIDYWRAVTGLPADQFRKPTLKRHNPKTIRKNTGDAYHGCLIIYVRRGIELYRQFEGWAAACAPSGSAIEPDNG